MFIDDYDNYIEKISLQNELKNVKEQLKAVQDENAKLKTDIDLHCKANAEKTEKIKRLSEELENDRSELLAIHTADVETINKLNIQVHDLNITITTLLGRLSKSTDENQELKKKVQELKDIIKDLGAKLYK